MDVPRARPGPWRMDSGMTTDTKEHTRIRLGTPLVSHADGRTGDYQILSNIPGIWPKKTVPDARRIMP
ncbi:hypothetical protein MishRS11D_37520 [Methylomagnum ishizawai]|nr:hypothetical protein MishRS11D_37520 [Methylomagnum ishizawai]